VGLLTLLAMAPATWAAVDANAPQATDTIADARLLRFPDVHGDTVAFSYAGDLWSVPLAGGVARRLTSHDGLEFFPRFSPDGRFIAFTGHYDGSSDVYVIPAQGGEPRRLTWYPSRHLPERMGWDHMVIGWTPDGKILYRDQRDAVSSFVGRPYTVSPEGGAAEPFSLPESGIISFAPDAKHIAYTRIFRDFRTWKRYKGGMAADVWTSDLAGGQLKQITDWKGADTQPMWIGNAIYFLSDRENWKLNLWRYDVASGQTSRVTDFKDYDVKWPHAGGSTIVFENGGYLYALDTAAGGAPRKITVALPDDRRLARRRWVKVEDRITDFDLAPGGKRALFTARGDVFSVPAENGNTRSLTSSQGVREKYAAWSPDGKWIAYVSDATGEEEVYVLAQDGKSTPVQVTSGSASWHYALVWSPDSKKLAWSDRGMHLWYVDVSEKKPVQVEKSTINEIVQYRWSPDSRWIAYTKAVDNDFQAVVLYSLDSRKSTLVTDDRAQSYEPYFDPEGRYLYFFSDRDINPTLGNFELSYTVNTPARPYAVTLRADVPSPFAPRSDEASMGDEKKKDEAEKDKDKGDKDKAAEKDKKKEPFRIDLDGLTQRIVGFPVPPGNYAGLRATKDKVLYLSFPTRGLASEGPQRAALLVYDLEKRKDSTLLNPVESYEMASDGSRVLYQSDSTYGIVEIKDGVKLGDGKLDLSGLKMHLDPKAEWAQIFRDAWRIERDSFYLPDMGGVDWAAIRRRYEPLVPFVSHRQDLTYLLGEMVGELATGHSYVGGGDQPSPETVPIGLLGADLALDRASGRWKIARIIEGQNWIESRRSPLTEPGVKVATGEYLIAIEGHELQPNEDPLQFLAQTVGHTAMLLVSARPSRDGAREVTVKPVGNEQDLRYFAWVETNRRKVDQATAGRVGYVHIPNMGAEGLQEFIRQYYPQLRKQGLIVDVRFNGGGFVSQMILERLRRILIGMGTQRDARPGTYPQSVFNGPMVALLNQYSASDGDIFPHYFREYGLGPLIGKRTWGGVVGIRGGNNLVDGGFATIPEFGSYNMKSEWIMENEGVAPDIDVDNPPADELAGRDPQLERGIQEVLKRVEERKPSFPPAPTSKDLVSPKP
jgi:tricorn protease